MHKLTVTNDLVKKMLEWCYLDKKYEELGPIQIWDDNAKDERELIEDRMRFLAGMVAVSLSNEIRTMKKLGCFDDELAKLIESRTIEDDE